MGPYHLGPVIRETPHGRLRLARHEAFSFPLELETYDSLARSSLVGPEGTLMAELAEVTRLEHPHVARIVGAGMEGSTPYVARVHVVGRTLAELLAKTEHVSPEVAACVLFAVASAAGYLASAGSAPGVCSLGGIEVRDVLLGRDGEILVTGAGLGRVRTPLGDPALADRASLAVLAAVLDRAASTTFEHDLRAADGFEDVARLVRHRYRSALGNRAALVRDVLREHFGEALDRERARLQSEPPP